jgi:hypothetical protein
MMRCEELSDTSACIGSLGFKLHRAVLGSRSEYFKNSLETKWRVREIRTEAISPRVFEQFIRFVYTGKLLCDRGEAEELSRLASKCKVKGLKEALADATHESEFFGGAPDSILRVAFISEAER